MLKTGFVYNSKSPSSSCRSTIPTYNSTPTMLRSGYGIILVMHVPNVLFGIMVKKVQSCRIAVESTAIHLGHPLLASCSSHCLRFGSGEVVWKLDNDPVPETHYRNVQENMSSVYFNSFNKTSGLLQCFVKSREGLQFVDQVRIQAGYPPLPPTNLSCLFSFTTNILTCTWQPGKDSLLPNNVTLSSSRSTAQCKIPIKSDFNCTPIKGQSSCKIYRKNIDLYKKSVLWVTEENELGSTTSTPLCITPGFEVKTDPIAFTDAQASGDCIKLLWTYGKVGFIKNMICQLRNKSELQLEWSMPIELPVGSKETYQCGLLSGTTYDFQIRCIRENFTGQWSDWGPAKSQTTSEFRAPSGKLKTWWKIIKGAPDSPRQIQLFWKLLKKEKANSKSLWYIVKTSTDLHQKDTLLCNTTALSCSFSLVPGMKSAFVWAHNKAGASPAQQVFFSINGAPVNRVHVSPINDSNLQVEWELQASAKSYVLEWCKSTQLPSCEIHWKTEHEGCNTSVVHENIEPLQMYTVKVYPIYENTVGLPAQIEVYSREGAPDFSPKLSLSTVSKSQAEVNWKPIPLENQNGFINYTIFWTDTNRRTYFSTLDGSATKFELKNLLPSTTYQVFLRSSTAGGSVNGSIMMLHTTVLDNTDISLIVLFITLLGFLVMIFIFIICIMKHERMKNHLWPEVPDPAKSRMGTWTSFMEEVAVTQRYLTLWARNGPDCDRGLLVLVPQAPRMIINPTDVSQIMTSEVIIVEDWQGKKPPNMNATKDTIVSDQNYFYATNKQISSAKDTTTNWRSYINTDTVEYAQIITEGYRHQSPSSSAHDRSDSMQPLLCDMSPTPSLQNCDNTWFHCSHQEDNVFLVEEGEALNDFPLLQALQIQEKGDRFKLFN
ncbi:granulocyte colony-stimulating factor receptor [Gastrophryne carolinensis]